MNTPVDMVPFVNLEYFLWFFVEWCCHKSRAMDSWTSRSPRCSSKSWEGVELCEGEWVFCKDAWFLKQWILRMKGLDPYDFDCISWFFIIKLWNLHSFLLFLRCCVCKPFLFKFILTYPRLLLQLMVCWWRDDLTSRSRLLDLLLLQFRKKGLNEDSKLIWRQGYDSFPVLLKNIRNCRFSGNEIESVTL